MVTDILRLRGHTIAGYIETKPGGESFLGAPIYGADELPRLRQRGLSRIIIAVGDCPTRLELADRAAGEGFTFITAIHPSAVVAGDVAIGEGTVVAAGAVINPGSVIGRHCIINTRSSVDHDGRIGDGVHIAPAAALAGNVTVGRASWVGIGSCVIQKITIGEGTMIGAGAVVIRDIPSHVTAVGVPAKVLKPV